MYYRLAGEDAPEAIKTALAWVLSSLADKHRTVEDEQRLIEILKIDPEILCSRQAQTDRCEARV